MNRLGKQNDGTQRSDTGKGGLDPEDDPPRCVGYDDASNEGT